VIPEFQCPAGRQALYDGDEGSACNPPPPPAPHLYNTYQILLVKERRANGDTHALEGGGGSQKSSLQSLMRKPILASSSSSLRRPLSAHVCSRTATWGECSMASYSDQCRISANRKSCPALHAIAEDSRHFALTPPPPKHI